MLSNIYPWPRPMSHGLLAVGSDRCYDLAHLDRLHGHALRPLRHRWLAHLEMGCRGTGVVFAVEDDDGKAAAVLRREPVTSLRSGVASHRHSRLRQVVTRGVDVRLVSVDLDEHCVHCASRGSSTC